MESRGLLLDASRPAGTHLALVRERLALTTHPEAFDALTAGHGPEPGPAGAQGQQGRGQQQGQGGVASSLDASVGLVGPHQHQNVAAAVAAVEVLRRRYGWRLPDEALAEGLAAAQLPGRFQVRREKRGTAGDAGASDCYMQDSVRGGSGKVRILIYQTLTASMASPPRYVASTAPLLPTVPLYTLHVLLPCFPRPPPLTRPSPLTLPPLPGAQAARRRRPLRGAALPHPCGSHASFPWSHTPRDPVNTAARPLRTCNALALPYHVTGDDPALLLPYQVLKLPGDDGPYVVLDGAHTEDSAAALAAAVRSVFPSPTPVALLLAMAADKEHRAVVAALRGLQPRVAIFTTVPIAGSYRRAAAPGAVAQWGGRAAGRWVEGGQCYGLGTVANGGFGSYGPPVRACHVSVSAVTSVVGGKRPVVWGSAHCGVSLPPLQLPLLLAALQLSLSHGSFGSSYGHTSNSRREARRHAPLCASLTVVPCRSHPHVHPTRHAGGALAGGRHPGPAHGAALPLPRAGPGVAAGGVRQGAPRAARLPGAAAAGRRGAGRGGGRGLAARGGGGAQGAGAAAAAAGVVMTWWPWGL